MARVSYSPMSFHASVNNTFIVQLSSPFPGHLNDVSVRRRRGIISLPAPRGLAPAPGIVPLGLSVCVRHRLPDDTYVVSDAWQLVAPSPFRVVRWHDALYTHELIAELAQPLPLRKVPRFQIVLCGASDCRVILTRHQLPRPFHLSLPQRQKEPATMKTNSDLGWYAKFLNDPMQCRAFRIMRLQEPIETVRICGREAHVERKTQILTTTVAFWIDHQGRVEYAGFRSASHYSPQLVLKIVAGRLCRRPLKLLRPEGIGATRAVRAVVETKNASGDELRGSRRRIDTKVRALIEQRRPKAPKA